MIPHLKSLNIICRVHSHNSFAICTKDNVFNKGQCMIWRLHNTQQGWQCVHGTHSLVGAQSKEKYATMRINYIDKEPYLSKFAMYGVMHY